MADSTVTPNMKPIEDDILPDDPNKAIMELLVKQTLRKLKDSDCTPAFLEFTRKLMQDNAVTLASVRRGDFGDVWKREAEILPFPDNQVQDRSN